MIERQAGEENGPGRQAHVDDEGDDQKDDENDEDDREVSSFFLSSRDRDFCTR